MMILTKSKLASAVAIAITGSALSVGAISDASAATTTMYNLTTGGGVDSSANTLPCSPCGVGATDGWLYGNIDAPSAGSDTSVAKWAGTSGTNKTPFGYTGAHLNWAVHIDSAGGTAVISNADSIARYGVSADIDTAKGAWSDNKEPGAAGWRHDLEFGLFKSDVGGLTTLNAQGVNNQGSSFGFTIFKGMSANTSYAHHGDWNAGSNASGLTSSSLPGGGTTFSTADIVAYSVGGASPSNLNTISFNADPGQIYTIVLGGYRDGAWWDTLDGYKVTVSAVPVPGAVWLFGSAMAGLIGFGRRNKRIA